MTERKKMNKNTADSTRNNHARSIVKAISLRKEATFTKMTVAFLFTKIIILFFSVVLANIMSKKVFYYPHERIWRKNSMEKWLTSFVSRSKKTKISV